MNLKEKWLSLHSTDQQNHSQSEWALRNNRDLSHAHRSCCARWILAISAMEDNMLVKNLVCNHPAMWRAVKGEPMSRPSDNVPCPSSFMFPTISPNHPHWLTPCSRRRQKLPWPQNILPTNTRVWIVSSCQFCAST